MVLLLFWPCELEEEQELWFLMEVQFVLVNYLPKDFIAEDLKIHYMRFAVLHAHCIGLNFGFILEETANVQRHRLDLKDSD